MNLTEEPTSSRAAAPTVAEEPFRLGFRTRWIALASQSACVLVFLALAANWLGSRLYWGLDLLGHFRVQWIVILTVLAILNGLCRQWRWSAAAGAAAGLLLASLITLLWPRVPAPAGPVHRAMLANIFLENRSFDRLLATIEAIQPDILVINELTPQCAAALADRFPHSITHVRTDPSGIGLFSRYPLDDSEIKGDDSGWPSIAATVALPDHAIKVRAAHPVPPATAELTRIRNQTIRSIARDVASNSGPTILLGDLNTTSWSYIFDDLVRTSGLRDSRTGFGIQPSWPTNHWVFWIPIDHCLVSPEVVVHRRSIGPEVGSDHYPVVVEFSIDSR